jgi:hypothetical protein
MEKKPVLRAIRLEEAVADLMDAEKIVAELESTDVLRVSTKSQRTHYFGRIIAATSRETGAT